MLVRWMVDALNLISYRVYALGFRLQYNVFKAQVAVGSLRSSSISASMIGVYRRM